MATKNLGNVVGLIKSPTPPAKTFVLWAKQLNPVLNPDLVELHYYNGTAWVPLTGGGSGGDFYFEVTRTQALDLVNTDNLVKGAMYKIVDAVNDSGAIYIKAKSENTFFKDGRRDAWYPIYYDTPSLLGMYVDVQQNPSTLYTGAYVIHGARVWQSLNGNASEPISPIELRPEDFILIERTDVNYYQEKEFGVSYNFDTDMILMQWDEFGNTSVTLKEEEIGIPFNYDFCDWLQAQDNDNGVNYKYRECNINLFVNNSFVNDDNSLFFKSSGVLLHGNSAISTVQNFVFILSLNNHSIEIFNSKIRFLSNTSICKIKETTMQRMYGAERTNVENSFGNDIQNTHKVVVYSSQFNQIYDSQNVRIENSQIGEINTSIFADNISLIQNSSIGNITNCTLSNLELISNCTIKEFNDSNSSKLLIVSNNQIGLLHNIDVAKIINNQGGEIRYVANRDIVNNKFNSISDITSSVVDIKHNEAGQIYECFNNGDISGNRISNYIGSIGANTQNVMNNIVTTIDACSNNGDIDGNIGGIIEQCYNSGDIRYNNSFIEISSMNNIGSITNNRCLEIRNCASNVLNVRNNTNNGTIDGTSLSGNIEDPVVNKS